LTYSYGFSVAPCFFEWFLASTFIYNALLAKRMVNPLRDHKIIFKASIYIISYFKLLILSLHINADMKRIPQGELSQQRVKEKLQIIIYTTN